MTAPARQGDPEAALPPVLPARVERSIRAAHDSAERTIGCFQMGIVIFFAGFYLLAPPPSDAVADAKLMAMLPGMLAPALEMVLAKPVPWALSVYFVLTVVRLAWSWKASLPAWALVGSIFIDVALLMALIWSFHIQYQQPPAFYLKAPTLIYVFIFIALRALRFEERYVLIAGVTAAAGWLVLVAYAALADAGGMPVTRNYVEYMSNPLILWGAEIDKVVTILVVTLVLCLAISNAREAAGARAGRGGGGARPQALLRGRRGRRDHRRRRARAAGTGRATRGDRVVPRPERLHDACRARCRPSRRWPCWATTRRAWCRSSANTAARVDKFLGDGILASFGATRPSTTHAADGRAAVDARWPRRAGGASSGSSGACRRSTWEPRRPRGPCSSAPSAIPSGSSTR